MSDDYFGEYLKIAPFALAIWRDQEATVIREAYSSYRDISKQLIKGKNRRDIFKRPVLDIGCGFGEFAGVFFESQVEVGIDISIDDLLRAEKRKKYKKLIVADARNLSFCNNSFSTVICVSVLEHINKPRLAIKEAYRVLRPGGIFIFTVPTLILNDCLFYPNIFSHLGLPKLASLYLKYYHRAFKHLNILPPQKWILMTKKNNFEIIVSKGTFSSRLIKIFDIFLLSALPSQIMRWLFGSRMVWGLPAKRILLDPLYKYILQDKKITLANILVLARKK